ncbi:MAG: transporter [Verrucomicrobiota bacterium]|jgi:hypothetical protein
MKIHIVRCLLAVALAAIPGALQAQPDAHYVTGLEGIKGASLPPPGFYVKDYNLCYVADQMNDPAGQKAPGKFDMLIYANVPRAIWITDTKLLGGNVGVDALLPLQYLSVKAGPSGGPYFDKGTFGIGDLFAESTLSWHPKQFDLAAGVGLFMPTGDSASPSTTRVGSGFWTPMLTAGATWYPDEAKTWAVSALSRYEFNTEDRDTHVTPGQAYTLEWGVSKSVTKTIDCGVVGYYQQRVTASKGDDPSAGIQFAAQEFPYSRVAAIGPEISAAFPSMKLFVSLRYDYEFMADSRAQGHTVALTLIKAF